MTLGAGEGLVYINGEYASIQDARLPITDSGFINGLTIFDSMSLYEGYLFRMDAHMDRLFRSLRSVRFGLPITRSALEELILETIRKSGLREAMVRTIVTRGMPQAGVPIDQWKPSIIIMAFPPTTRISPEKREQGYRMRISSVRNVPVQTLDTRIKNYNRLFSYVAGLEAFDAGADDVLLLDLEGYVTEGPSFNVFVVHDNRIHTPSEGILQGITRDTIIKIAAQEGIEVTEAQLTSYDLYNADEVFFSSTSRGAVGIVEVDRRVIGTGKPGPVSQRLNDIYWTWHRDKRYALPVTAALAIAALG